MPIEEVIEWGFYATMSLKAGLCFLRAFDISCSFLTAAGALNLGGGFPLSYLSSLLGPPQVTHLQSVLALRIFQFGWSFDTSIRQAGSFPGKWMVVVPLVRRSPSFT
jgi:hypothetical protein